MMKKPNGFEPEDFNKQKVRIEYLEKTNRWHLFALELLASLGDMYGDANQNRDPAFIFRATRKHLKRVVDIPTLAFFRVDPSDSSFVLTDCEPEPDKSHVQRNVQHLIENGTFAWTLKQNRALIVQDKQSGEKLVLKTLATKSRVLGMFVGKLGENHRKVSAEQLALISIILHNTSNALENEMLYKLVSDQNQDLEETVRKRTLALQKQMEELKREIAERNRAEKAFDSLNRKNESILTSAGEGIFGLDLQQNITFTNPMGARMSGYQMEELIGQSMHSLLQPMNPGDTSQAQREFPIYKVLEENIPCCMPDEMFWRKDGTSFPVGYTCNPIRENGKVAGAVVTFRDISERKKAEEELKLFAAELQRSNQELQDFASIASHDLKEPLRKVIMFGDRLKSDYAKVLDTKAKDYLERMEKATQRMQQFIDDLLQYSKVSLKARPFEPTDLGEVISETLCNLEARLVKSRGRVEVQEMPVIEADPFQMRQLFMNLISNALKFRKNDEDPIVSISCRPGNNGFLEVAVKDNGIGFDNKFIDRIFKPFERLHGRSAYEGSGMGLAICRKIVARHGGTLTAESAPQEGATFIITVPKKQPGNK